MADKGAFALQPDAAIPFLHLSHPLWARENIYIVPEVAET